MSFAWQCDGSVFSVYLFTCLLLAVLVWPFFPLFLFYFFIFNWATGKLPSRQTGLLLGRSEVLRSLRHYLRAQSQGHDTTDRRREALKEKALDDLPWKDERGPSSIRRTLEPLKGNVGETSERRGGAHNYGLFRAHRYHLQLNEMNWTEPVFWTLHDSANRWLSRTGRRKLSTVNFLT